MKKILRLSLALLLTFSLIFSSMIFASAEIAGTDVTDEASFFAAIEAKASVINIKNGFTISSSTSPTISFNTTIKGNGNKIILGARIVFSGGVSTVDNLHVERANGNDCYFMQGSAAVTIYGGSMRQFSTSGDNTCICIDETFDGVVNVTGGAQMTACRYLIVSDTKGTTKGGTINLLNCTLKGTTNGNDSIKLRSGQTLNIGNTANGEKTVMNLTGDGFYMCDTASSVINIYDGAVINCANHFSNLYASGTPMINVYGGTITCANRLFLSQNKAIFNVYGGTMKSTSTEGGRIFALRSGSSAVVMGGTFTNGASAPLDPDESSSLKIAGGSFNFDPSAYVVSNYASSNSNGTYNVALSLGTPVNVASASQLSEAITNKAPYIKITAPISMSEAAVFRYDAYIDGGNNLLTNNQIATYESVVVTLKDVNIERASDVIRIDNNSHVTISGGTVNCTGSSFNNGAIYVTDTFTGRVVVTDDAVIKADKLYAFYTGYNNSSSSGGMVEFIDCEVTSNCSRTTLGVRSNIAVTIGGGTEGQTANITNKGYKVFYNDEKGWGAVLNIKDGAVITQTTGAYAIHLNKTTIFNMTGGKINSKGQGIVVDASNSFASVSGGTFVTTNENCIQKNNGALLVSGGNFTSNYSVPAALYSSTRSEKAGAFLIDVANITVADGTALLSHNGAFYTVISNADMEQDGVIIDILANGGDITLNNCQLTSAGTTISSAAESVIRLENNTVVSSINNEPIVGGTVEKDDTSSIGVPTLHPLVQAINDAPAGGTVTVNEAYTDVPAITLEKDLTFTGEGSIAFKTTGFVIKDSDITFNGNITVTMGVDDNGDNRLIELANAATTASTLTINGGTFNGYMRVGGGKVTGDTLVTINGGTFNQKNHQLFDISNGFTNLTINGGNFVGNGKAMLIRTNDGAATLRIYGGTFTQSGNNEMLHIRNLKEFTIGNADGTGPEMTHTGAAFLMKIGATIDKTNGKYNINGGTFTKKGGEGYLFDFNSGVYSQFNINGGYWKITHNASLLRVNDTNVKDLRVNGGTFETTSSSEPILYKNNGTLTVTGGTYITSSSAGAIHTGNNCNAGKLTIDGTNDPNAIVFKHKGYGPAIYYRSQNGLEIKNVNLSRTGDYAGTILAISSTAANTVTITDSTLTSDYVAVELGDDLPTSLKTTNTFTNSRFVSNQYRAIANLVGLANGSTNANYYDNMPATLENCEIVDATDLRADTNPKMFRFAGNTSGSGSVVAVYTTSNTLTAGTYTLTLNYRETGGAMPYVTVRYDGATKTIPADSYDNRGFATYTFTLAADGQVTVGIGRETAHQAGAIYYGNVKLTAAGSSENLLNNTVNNADLSASCEGTVRAANYNATMPGWKHQNVSSYNSVRVMAIPSDDFFTADNPVAENYVYKFEDGDNFGVRLRFHMKEDTRYEFSYNYMSTNGNIRDIVSKPGMDRPFTMETVTTSADGQYKTVVIFDLGNDGDDIVEREGSTIRISGSKGAYGVTQYIGNFEMYEIDKNGNRITGRNLMAAFNPIYETEGTFEFTDNSAVASGFENAYGIHFDNTSSKASAGQIVKVDDNFFKKLTFAERRTNARKYLIQNDAHTDLTFDYSADGKVNVIDLLKVKKYEKGYIGADLQADALKSEILNAPNTTPADSSKVLYVSYSGGDDSNDGKSESKPLKNLSTAISKASSGWTILLKRGDEWRIPYNTDSNGWTLKSGITLGSYGTGAKPVLNGSAKNYANETWTEVSDNIWKYSFGSQHASTANIPGNVYFYKNANDAEPTMIGTIVKDRIPIGQTWDSTKNSGKGAWVDSSTPMAKLTKNGDILKDYDAETIDWNDFGSILGGIFGGTSGSTNNVYVYYDGDLNNDFARIEITESKDTLFAEEKSNIKIDNIEVKHAGAHGINLKRCSNVTISNCVVGYIGGAPSENTALGNGIQFGMSGSNCTVNKTYVYQCYDAGISPQNWEKNTTYNFENIVFSNNLLEKNFYNVEIWNNNGGMGIAITGNIFKDAAYGWSFNQRYDNGNHNIYGAHFYGGKNAYNSKLKFTITDNIFDNTQANIFCWFWGEHKDAEGNIDSDKLPEKFGDGSTHYMNFSGNTYYQRNGSHEDGQVMYYGNTTSRAYATCQTEFEKAIDALDSEAVAAGRVQYIPEMITNLAAGK